MKLPQIPSWIILVVFFSAVGAYADHKFFPRVETVQVAKEVTKLVPVPGPTVVKTVIQKVPVEVVRPGPERIVTVTKEVRVPVEVVREKWPQTITVRVGGVLSGGRWYTPDHEDLLVGQVTTGVYAVPSNQLGWRVEEVRTETKVSPGLGVPLPYNLGFGVRMIIPADLARTVVFAGAVYQNYWSPHGGIYEVGIGFSTAGLAATLVYTVPLR
jgi:hypothetical protein